MEIKVILKIIFQVVTQVFVPIGFLLILIVYWKTLAYSDKILIIGLIIIFLIGFQRCLLIYSVYKKTSLYEYEASIILLTIFTINYIAKNDSQTEVLTIYTKISRIIFYCLFYMNFGCIFLGIMMIIVFVIGIFIMYCFGYQVPELNLNVQGLTETELNQLNPRPFIEIMPILQQTLNDINDFSCSICLSNFSPEEIIIQLPFCNHVFHFECIKMWLNSHINCPFCRANIRHNLSLKKRQLRHQQQN